jgi:hypothetical protein
VVHRKDERGRGLGPAIFRSIIKGVIQAQGLSKAAYFPRIHRLRAWKRDLLSYEGLDFRSNIGLLHFLFLPDKIAPTSERIVKILHYLIGTESAAL